MSKKIYSDIASNAIDSVIIDNETNQVVVKYKSSEKSYTYSTEDAEEFNTQLLAEFDDLETASIGKFMNQSVSQGKLQLIQD